MNHRTVSAFVVLLQFAFLVTVSPLASAQDSSEILLTVAGKPVVKDELVYLISKGKGIDGSKANLSRDCLLYTSDAADE